MALNIVKVGGNIIESPEDLKDFLRSFSAIPEPKILIHGGGRAATRMAEKLGLDTQMTNGRRITDAETLEVITMVYAGKVSKQLVAGLQALNCNAVGLSGADGNTILSVKRPVREVDFGYVGDVIAVNPALIKRLSEGGFTPVFCALTHDGQGQLLNTNADTIACDVARSLAGDFEVVLSYCFEKAGVLEDISDENSVIREIDSLSYKKLLSDGIIAEGMLPKLQNCFYALEGGVAQVRLGKTDMLDDKETNFTTIQL